VQATAIVVLTAYPVPSTIFTGLNGWDYELFDSVTGFRVEGVVGNSFGPSGTVHTQVVMGNFEGDGFSEALLFFASENTSTESGEWAMQILSHEQPDILLSPEMDNVVTPGGLFPVDHGIVTTDFNGDGRDEIAALMSDYQTVVFFNVDPQTLGITQTTTVKLPYQFVNGQATIAAGVLRTNTVTAANVPSADAVVIGQLTSTGAGYSLIPIQVTPGSNDLSAPPQ
jgi:hypothetical protein